MTKRNPENERAKRGYFNYLRNAKGKDDTTIDKAAAAILRYEKSTNFKLFKQFHLEDVNRFKRQFVKEKSAKIGTPLAAATVDAGLRMIKAFFEWLAGQQGYKSRIKLPDTIYLTTTPKMPALPKPNEKSLIRHWSNAPTRSIKCPTQLWLSDATKQGLPY